MVLAVNSTSRQHIHLIVSDLGGFDIVTYFTIKILAWKVKPLELSILAHTHTHKISSKHCKVEEGNMHRRSTHLFSIVNRKSKTVSTVAQLIQNYDTFIILRENFNFLFDGESLQSM
jgi:hypothetical protein